AVEDDVTHAHRLTDFFAELRPLLELVPLAGDESGAVSLDNGESTEAVMLQLKEPVRMVERLSQAKQRHWTPGHDHKKQSRVLVDTGQRVTPAVNNATECSPAD